MAVHSRRNLESLPTGPSHRSDKPPEHHQKFFGGVYLSTVMTNEDQQRVARWTNATASSTASYLHPFQTSHVFSSTPLQQNITCAFSRQLPEKHHAVLSKISFHKMVSRKTAHDTTESPRKPEISTSDDTFKKTDIDSRETYVTEFNSSFQKHLILPSSVCS